MPNEPYVAWVPRYFNVALSGGGHRASLFTLGALLYITDAGANDRVEAISSVSGGSITNGFVAQECSFVDVEPNDFEKIAASLSRTIVHRGLLKATLLSRLYLYTLLVGALLTLSSALFYWPIPISHRIELIAFVFLSSVFLMRGLVIERILLNVLFYNRLERRGTMLGDLRRRCDHIFCTTDLVLGKPFYFVARKSGPFAGYSRLDRDDLKEGTWVSAENTALATAVRASAAFPGGLPPKLMVNSDRPSKRWPKASLLADGGVWNNLGTQWWEKEDGSENLLIADASAPIPSVQRSWLFGIPLLSEVLTLSRTMSLLYVNTLHPRISHMDHSAPGTGYGGVKVVISLGSDVGATCSHIMRATEWRLQTSDMAHEDTDRVLNVWHELKGLQSRCWEWSKHQKDLQEALNFRDLQKECLAVPTTLSRVSAKQATALMIYGYVLAQEALYIGFGTKLMPVPDRQRFAQMVR